MTTYTLDPITGVLSKDDGSIIPQDDTVQAYLDYVTWLNAGNSPTSYHAPSSTASRRISKLSFINRFTDVESASIITISKTVIEIETWLFKLNMTTPEPDGTSIDLDDPRTVAGVTAILYTLEQAGAIAAGTYQTRVEQILS